MTPGELTSSVLVIPGGKSRLPLAGKEAGGYIMIRLDDLLLGIEIWGAVFSLLIFIIIQRESNRTTETKIFAAMQVTCFFYILSDVLSWILQGHVSPVCVSIEHISTFFFYLCGYLLLALYTKILFLDIEIKRRDRILQHTVYGMVILESALLIWSQFNDMFYYFDAGNFYHRAQGYIWSQVFVSLGMFMNCFFIFSYFRKMDSYKRIAMSSYILLPLIALILQFRFYGLSFVCISMIVSNIIMFVLNQRRMQKEFLENQEKMIRQREMLFAQQREIHDMQYRIVLSQIQPHFLYNALNAIYYLCESDPGKAQEAIGDFSEYLRGNMKFIQFDQTIPFEEELQHIRHYLSLEKIRFDEDLEIQWDIRKKDFMVPPLSIQPIVENAVKHGLGKKEGGGYVKISTDQAGSDIRIMVVDNGVGFDPENPLKDGRIHIGLENVRTRLKQMVGGSIILDSRPGRGTKVTVIIPSEGENG